MKNREIAEMLYEIADFLEIQDEQYKPRAYRRAARNIDSLSEDIEDIYQDDELEEIEGVGESIAEKIAEYLETGELDYYESLKAELPIDIDAITSVEGVGPETAKTLYQERGIATLEDLERAAEEGRIATVEGFGETSQQNILNHTELAKQDQERMLLGRVLPIARDIETRLQEWDVFDRVDIVGSFRRRRPTVGDIDVLGTAGDSRAAIDRFCSHDDVAEVIARGDTKASVLVSNNLQIDLRLVDEREYGAALVYFTGSKDHNITLRNLAIEFGMKLNEYGLFDVSDVDDPRSGQRVGEWIAGETEASVYEALDTEWIPPELREDTGEVDAAATDSLPELVESADIRGDLQVHTEYSDGTHSVREMAEAADQQGLEYILLTDHGPGAPIPDRIETVEEFEQQRTEIDEVNADDSVDVVLLHGIEAEITTEGLGISESWCDRCDMVVAGMHTTLSNPTDVLLDTFESGRVDIFAHPTNRLINEREPVDLQFDAITEKAAKEGIALEINAQPERLDLDWSLVKEYRDTVTYAVATDAHTGGDYDFLDLGISQARRGWCEVDDIINSRPLDELKQFIDG